MIQHSFRLYMVAGVMAIATTQAVRSSDGDVLLRQVRDAFPRDEIRVSARLMTMDARGTVERIYEAELDYLWREGGYRSVVRLYDRFGTELVRRIEEREMTGEVDVSQYSGPEQTPVEPSELYEQVLTTDFTWSDISLSFLWWRNAKVIGATSLKGRDCRVLEVAAPEDAGEGIAIVRLWVDEAVHALLRAEYLDERGQLIRRFDVKSFAKRNDLFTIQDIDVRSYPSRRRTALRVRDIDLAGQEDQ